MNIMDGHGREFNRGIDPAENLKKKPRKSILKSSSSFEVPEGPSSSKRKPAHTKWDEQNIKETLHPVNKDYGHMKIEEPKTPYERLVHDEVDASRGVDPNQLAERLNQNLQKKKHRGGSGKGGSASRRGGPQSDSSDDETPDQKAKKKDFESRRKLHYNEFLAAKEALKNMKDDEEEEEE